MAKVYAQVIGGSPKEYTADTLADLISQEPKFASYQASINGTPETDTTMALEDFNVVTFAEKIKGA